jgi:hypothetical protein
LEFFFLVVLDNRLVIIRLTKGPNCQYPRRVSGGTWDSRWYGRLVKAGVGARERFIATLC